MIVCVCVGTHVLVRGQFVGITSSLSPWRGRVSLIASALVLTRCKPVFQSSWLALQAGWPVRSGGLSCLRLHLTERALGYIHYYILLFMWVPRSLDFRHDFSDLDFLIFIPKENFPINFAGKGDFLVSPSKCNKLFFKFGCLYIIP